MVGDVTLTLDPSAILVWAFIGLVAGFLASKVMFGHGMGLFADIIVGIIGALGGGLLLNYMGVNLGIAGQPIISEIIVGFIGAVILLAVLRAVGARRGRHALVR